MQGLSARVLSDRSYVDEQYRDSQRLRARIGLYRRYAQPDQAPFARWVFDAIDFAEGARVLEVGCGTGEFWAQNADRIPSRTHLTLSDASAAMVDRARNELAAHARALNFQVLDAADIPHPDAAFDVLIANHVLYHVPDRPRALRELRRVLRPGGTLYVTTNAWTHLLELRELCDRFYEPSPLMAARRIADAFDVDNAGRELQRVFEHVTVRSRSSALEVDDPLAITDYVRSMMPGDAPCAAHDALLAYLHWRITLEGCFRITAVPALLIAR